MPDVMLEDMGGLYIKSRRTERKVALGCMREREAVIVMVVTREAPATAKRFDGHLTLGLFFGCFPLFP